jgi:surface protein
MATTYTRPSDWLTIPTVASSAQTFVGLFAVLNNDVNYVALKATTSTGNYQVDWGDGNITTHASNTNAEYLYTYSAISESTLSSRGYKQVLITVTPLTGNITVLNTNVPHSALGVVVAKKVTWLEYLINLPSLTSLSIAPTSNNPRPSWLEKVTISHLGSITSLSSAFSSLFGLKEVNITASTTGITNTSYMFASCTSLISVNLFNTSNVTNAVQMFYGCSNLEQVPNFNLSKVTTAISMFDGCSNLKTVPALDMRLTTDFSSMFANCGNLTEIPLIDTRSGTNFGSFASGCAKLKTVANLDMSKATIATSAFFNCYSLDNLPAITVGAASSNLTSFLNGCYMMKNVGNIDVSKAITFTNFFIANHSLRTLPPLNLNSGTTLTTMVSPVMARAPFTNVRASLNLANKNLGRNMIIEVFNGLASGVTSRTITVSANPGFSALTAADRLIATAKGWTIA